jgi:diaminopimelate decarboxylase
MIQGFDAVGLAREYGTPLHVVSKKRLVKKYREFYECFRSRYPNFEIGYSYKTNPIPGVLKILHELGASAEVVSHFELWLALELGVRPERIIYNGPGKTEASLDLAVSSKVKLININDFEEIEVIDKLAQRYSHIQQVGVRVVTSEGWTAKFGLPIKDGTALRAFRHLKNLENVHPCGIHVHLGTGIRNIEKYLRAIKEVLDFSLYIRNEYHVEISYFDFGGGFCVPTVRGYSRIDRELFDKGLPAEIPDVSACPTLDEYGEEIIKLFTKYYPSELDDSPTIILEPGRAITSSAQCLLLSVMQKKPSKNQTIDVIVDGGTNVAWPSTYEYHEIFPASKMSTPADTIFTIHGPLCHPTDVIVRAKKLPRLESGDILAIMDSGAYFLANQQNFCFPRPAIVLVGDGRHRLIRSRESFENMIVLDNY